MCIVHALMSTDARHAADHAFSPDLLASDEASRTLRFERGLALLARDRGERRWALRCHVAQFAVALNGQKVPVRIVLTLDTGTAQRD